MMGTGIKQSIFSPIPKKSVFIKLKDVYFVFFVIFSIDQMRLSCGVAWNLLVAMLTEFILESSEGNLQVKRTIK